MTSVFRRAVAFLGILTFSTALAACSNSGASDAIGTSGEGAAMLAVDTTQRPFVYLENLTAEPLIDVNVTLKAGILSFSETLSRLEPKERRQLRHADFASRDGTSFNLRITTPREVLVTAKNLGGKQIGTTTSWR